ncbi:lecithin retinol acyltransferase family protein [Almyronema epifaneia]|uniref:Lecithin retinol acyltransferase family protein n=1 Tax=Almyronema epifaneia S1 TaxID=2991925 RepID=A0ABW6IEQ7_9CYAN
MARGDQIYAMRQLMGLAGVYEHHGIDCGDGTVIHYRKLQEAVISRTDYRAFAQGTAVFTRHQPVAFIPDVVIERAESRLGERRYDLLTNNCEHFATWCKTGRSESAQLTNFGWHLDRFKTPELRQTINQVAQGNASKTSLELIQSALGNIAIAQQTIAPQSQQAQREIETWHRVAQLAVKQGRDDLARAALHRKVAAKRQQADLQSQLDQLLDLQTTLQNNQQLTQS